MTPQDWAFYVVMVVAGLLLAGFGLLRDDPAVMGLGIAVVTVALVLAWGFSRVVYG